MANCFIVMPITTPETLAPSYGNDREHFLHVLEHLFVLDKVSQRFVKIAQRLSAG